MILNGVSTIFLNGNEKTQYKIFKRPEHHQVRMNQPKRRRKHLKDSSALFPCFVFSFSIIKANPKNFHVSCKRGILIAFHPGTIFAEAVFKTPAEDLSRLRLFEVTELDESRSDSQRSLHVNLLQCSIKNLTILQPLPIESYPFFPKWKILPVSN